MKCPKCGYLGFEHVDRCRNCGYDFSLSEGATVPELPIRDHQAHDDQGLDDLTLIGAAAPMRAGAQPPGANPRAPGPPTSGELPLFGQPSFERDDEPLIKKPSPPRQPLSVRRATPEVAKVRSPRMPMLDLVQEAEPSPVAQSGRAHTAAQAEGPPQIEYRPAPFGARSTAAVIDLVVLGAIDLIVVYFTMEICGLSVADYHVLPKAPLGAFLLIQNGGYLVSFTMGGQTLGKMAAGLRVIPARRKPPIDVNRSIVRALVWIALAAPVGLGFLTALIGPEHRGLHDRCAGTRVVRDDS